MQTPNSAAGVPRSQLVYPRERVLYAAVVAVSLLVYGGIGLVAVSEPGVGASAVFYVALFALAGTLAHGLALGRIRGSAVRVSERQFPLLHRLVQEHARRLGLKRAPEIYLLESGGLLNAFAARCFGRDFIVVHSDVLALALERGEDAVSFVVAHELGHHWRGHLKRRWLTAPGRFVPYLGAAYSRACEYTCDRIGAYCQPEGAISGLMALAAGPQLYQHVDVREFAAQAERDKDFWVRRAELMASHPRLPKRVAALLQLGVALPKTAELPTVAAA
ncbi:MAG TPA: M48 family metallopeptidase [Gemmatimonadales bacterium]|nr:M48 family metallopeptidase [Gemmatimonadales bacterium]